LIGSKKSIKKQLKYMRKNVDLILKDIEKNADRLFFEGGKFSLRDYENIIDVAFGNWVRPTEKSEKIYYRIFVTLGNPDFIGQ